MRNRTSLLLYLIATLMVQPAAAATVQVTPSRVILKDVQMRAELAPPKIDYTKLNRPGPVQSPDPYFTLRLGEAEIYRDAKDTTLAYYRPILRLGKRADTPLAEGVGELAAELDGFRFRYYKFESGGSPKWANMQVVVVAERPEEATLENVKERWPDIARLIPLPFRLDARTGVKLDLPYPPRVCTFSKLEATGGTEDLRWYYFSTNTRPTPPDLLTDEDNDCLNETKARDFAALIISDLADMPSFQPTLEVRAVFPGWRGKSPLIRNLAPVLKMKPVLIAPAGNTGSGSTRSTGKTRRTLRIPMQLTGQPIAVASAVSTTDARIRRAPARTVIATPTKTVEAVPMAATAVLRPDMVRVIGTLKPRADVQYEYSAQQELIVRVPITLPKDTTANYDYYFLSDSGRFGGPYFEPSSQPDRPQRAAAPEGFLGYWYESHFYGRRLVWPAPAGLRLAWDVESGLRPSCRFSLSSDQEGLLTAHISYDLYPDFSMRQLSQIVADLEQRTGEEVQLLPFTDVIDANQIELQSANPFVQDLVAAKQLSVSKLSPRQIGDAWFRASVELPIDDWATFTLFMKLGELGLWEFGILTGATSGTAEEVSFELNGDLLRTMGGPILAASQSYDPGSGVYEVSFDNYGIQPLSIDGLRFALAGEESATTDIWFDEAIAVPEVSSASSFDQSEGAGGSFGVTVEVPESPELRTLRDSGKYTRVAVQLTRDMIHLSDAPEDLGGTDPDILFSFLRSLCYQYIGSSDIIEVPVAPAELSQWVGYRSGRIVLRYQGFVYTHEIDLSSPNKVVMRRLPREGAYASAGKPGEADLLEYRAVFTRDDDTVVYLPSQPEGESVWLTGDISGLILDMTQAQ